jgi:predicted anti-sigma-YlaC factor YlaD
MRCDDARSALSAQLDGEAFSVPKRELDAHLGGCSLCGAWLEGAERITRTVRVQRVEVPDLTARILAAVRADGSLPVAKRALVGVAERLGLRWALGIITVVQLMLAIPDLLGAVGHEAHAGREVAAFDIALAVGLLVVACYPEYARVFAPVVATLVVCFASASVLDIMEGLITPDRVAVHSIALVQAGLVWLLARSGQRRPVAAM